MPGRGLVGSVEATGEATGEEVGNPQRKTWLSLWGIIGKSFEKLESHGEHGKRMGKVVGNILENDNL